MRSRDAKGLLRELETNYSNVDAKKVEVAEFEENKIYFFDEKIEFIEDENGLYPFLGGSYLGSLPSLEVDMGAIRFVCNGADVMAPGIVKVDEFDADSLVVIRDVSHGKALSIGRALKSSAEIESNKKGKVIKNLHYVGDKLWENASV